jgi:hypothetical protein
MTGEDSGIGVVAISAHDAVAVGVAITVGVAIDVRAGPTFFDASVDGAGPVVTASRRLTAAATERDVTHLDAIAEKSILAARIVRHVLTASKPEVANVEGAFDGVVALTIFEARSAEGDAAVVDRIDGDGVGAGVAGARIDHKGAGGAARAPHEPKDDPDRAEGHARRSVSQVPKKALSRGP